MKTVNGEKSRIVSMNLH